MVDPAASDRREPDALAQARAQNAALLTRLQELEDTLSSIHRGDVDALVVNGGIYTLESAQESTSRMRQDVLGQMKDAVFAFDTEDHIVYVNDAAERRYGVHSADVLGRHRSQVYTEQAPERAAGDPPVAASAVPRASVEAIHVLANGTQLRVETIVSPLRDAEGGIVGSLAVIRDVSQRHRERSRREAQAGLSDRLRDVDDPEVVRRETARVLGETLAAGRVGCGALASGLLSPAANEWARPGTDATAGAFDLQAVSALVDNLRRNQLVAVDDVFHDARTASASAALLAQGARALLLAPLVEGGDLVGALYVLDDRVRHWSLEDLHFVRDLAERMRVITERLKAVAALRDSEARLRQANENLEAAVAKRTDELMLAEEALRQSQKMEAVGQLTGGIAHDFNNLLAAISASLQVLKARVARGNTDNIERYVGMGQDAVQRAASLTQRLLAFARRQTLDPRATHVNRLVSGMSELIRRTVGPNVHLDLKLAPTLWITKVDPSQLENSLLNLCINARDAMAQGGGELTIETGNDSLDAAGAAPLDLAAGDYVRLCVRDTGSGMSDEVIKRIFDPFFTTKPMGHGTGLGLSMVYGFVRQSGGQVRVHSTPGQGTSFQLYMPRLAGEHASPEEALTMVEASGGRGESVMVVEDEATIRTLVAETLHEAGYEVATADDGAAALQMLGERQRIDLLLTDIGLPGGMNGRQLADAARRLHPSLRVLFVTGYAESAAVREGLVERGTAVLTKPLDLSMLLHRMRELLDAASSRAGVG